MTFSHLDNRYKSWLEERGKALKAEKIDPFEYYCVDQFLKFIRLPMTILAPASLALRMTEASMPFSFLLIKNL